MAPINVSLAKLSRPRLYEAVPRDRLFDLLDRARHHPLIWVGAPPGAGKTTLVGSWIEARRLPHRWYQMDAGDADPATFFSCLIELAGDRGGSLPPLPYLTPEYLRDLPGFSRRFFQALFSRLPNQTVLVLDNAHEAAGNTLATILLEAAGQIPKAGTLVVVSRGQPPLGLTRLRANNDLSMVGWKELRLTVEETAAIVRKSSIGTPPTIEDLQARSDGWAAGLVLLLAQLQRNGVDRSLTSLDSKEAIFAYFAGEVFDRAAPQERDVLMKTALLTQVAPAMAELLTGDSEAPQILERLFRMQYFTDRRTEPQVSYRYHDLFREFLLARAESAWSIDTQSENRKRAAELLLEHGQVEEATMLLLTARQFNRAALVIENQASSLLSQGRWVTLQKWIEALPLAVVQEHPWLDYWYGTSSIPIDQKAGSVLAEVYQRFVERGDRRGQLLSVCGIAEVISLTLDDVSNLDPWIPLLERLVTEEAEHLNESERFRSYSTLLTALFWRQPGHACFEQVRAKMHRLVVSGYDAKVQFSGGLQILQVANLLGDWNASREIIDRILPAIESGQCAPPVVAQWCAYVGYHHYVLARDAIAWEWFRRSEQVALANSMVGTATMVRFFWTYSAVACGDARTAREVLDRTQGARLTGAFDRAQYHMAKARLAALTGDRIVALTEAREAVKAADDTRCPMMHTFWNSVVGGIFADFGSYEESATHLELARGARRISAIGSYDAYMLMLDAYLSLEWRRDGRAVELLRQSLAVARERRNHYYYRSFVRNIAQCMLDLALEEGIDIDFVMEIIRELKIRPVASCGERWPWRIKVYTLGRFSIKLDGQPLLFGRKVPKKPLALLQCLISMGADEVPEYRIADALWPEADGDDAQRRLGLAMHRLRKLLGDSEALRVQAGKISLDRGRVWVDALFVEDTLTLGHESTLRLGAVVRLTKGGFLESEPDEPWIVAARTRLRRIFGTRVPKAFESESEKKTLPV